MLKAMRVHDKFENCFSNTIESVKNKRDVNDDRFEGEVDIFKGVNNIHDLSLEVFHQMESDIQSIATVEDCKMETDIFLQSLVWVLVLNSGQHLH